MRRTGSGVTRFPARLRSGRRLLLRSLPFRLRIPAAFLLLACALTFAPVAGSAWVTQPGFPPPVPGWSFPQRQTLTYSVDWRVFPAGTATVHLEADGPLERVTVAGDSQGAINLLFRVSDRFQSSFNRTTGCSQSFSRQIMEGRRQIDSDQRIDSSRGMTFYDERNLVSHIHVRQSAAIPPCVTDMLSGIIYAGSQTLEPGGIYHVPVVNGDHVSQVTLRVETRETVRTPTTTYRTIRVQPTADSGAIRNRGKLWIWYSDDQRHIPVQMRARLFWGTLTFRLTGIDNK